VAQRKNRIENPTLGPSFGYSLVAQEYEHWHWFKFWQNNEKPIVQQWANSLTPGTLLDAGSGTGWYRQLLEEAGHVVISVDISPEMLEIQRRRSPSGTLINADICKLPFPDSYFDYVLCTRVLSHIKSLKRVLNEFTRVTKHGARIFIADIHPEHHYTDMSVPVNGERISIETHKHSVEEIKRSIRSPLELISFKEYRLEDVPWKPPTQNFGNIYVALGSPIFYVAILRRI
jgi:ubiquinone/menaquinone biosynthesis C-methylase UbiE